MIQEIQKKWTDFFNDVIDSFRNSFTTQFKFIDQKKIELQMYDSLPFKPCQIEVLEFEGTNSLIIILVHDSTIEDKTFRFGNVSSIYQSDFIKKYHLNVHSFPSTGMGKLKTRSDLALFTKDGLAIFKMPHTANELNIRFINKAKENLRIQKEHEENYPELSDKNVSPFQDKKEIDFSQTINRANNRVFIVHGKDFKAINELKEILKALGLEPIVLHEQASGGSLTIAEKLDKYSNVGYAFVILTPDDIGCQIILENGNALELTHLLTQKSESEIQSLLLNKFKLRARQNVVLEFGYFAGKLGRNRVCCLLKGKVEKPSDMDGIVYISFAESVKETSDIIVKELIEAGYKINKK